MWISLFVSVCGLFAAAFGVLLHSVDVVYVGTVALLFGLIAPYGRADFRLRAIAILFLTGVVYFSTYLAMIVDISRFINNDGIRLGGDLVFFAVSIICGVVDLSKSVGGTFSKVYGTAITTIALTYVIAIPSLVLKYGFLVIETDIARAWVLLISVVLVGGFNALVWYARSRKRRTSN